MAEAILINDMSIVEEKIILARQLNFNILQRVLSLYLGQRLFTYLELQNFDSDGFECSDLLWAAVRVLNAQFEWRFSIVSDDMSLSYQVKKLSHLPREGSISSIAEKSNAFSTDC